MSSPALWIGCLASYNGGRLHGKWFTPTDYGDAEEFAKAVDDFVLKKSPAPGAEEMYVGDHEHWCGYEIDQYYLNWPELYAIAEWIEDNEDAAEAFIHICEEDFPEVTLDNLKQVYESWIGVYDSFSDYATECADQNIASMCGHANEALMNFVQKYFDYDQYERELEADVRSFEGNGQTFVFRNA